MKRAALLNLTVAVWSVQALPALGQPPVAGLPGRPSAALLLEVPISGNPVGNPPVPDIRNPYAGDAGAVVQGEKLFNGLNCSGCHAPLGGGGMGPPLSDRAWIYGSAPAAIYLSIVQGRPNGMPAWGRSLPPESLWQLVAYIETLSRAPAPAAGPPEPPARPKRRTPHPLGLP
jgi:cytochrome c oxidase cbb3-type subunit 3